MKKATKLQEIPKASKKGGGLGGGGSIACSKDKRVSYRRFGLMSYFQTERINERLHPLIKGLREIMRSRLSKFTASGLIIGARDYYPKVILLFVL